MKSNELIELIPKKFQNSIERAIFVNNRRWNLKLKNNILLKLHEFDINQSIKNYEKIFMKFSNSELSDIKSIDFRIQNKAIIKYD